MSFVVLGAMPNPLNCIGHLTSGCLQLYCIQHFKITESEEASNVCAMRYTSVSFRFTNGSRKHLQGIPETARIVPGTPGKKRRRARVIPDPLRVLGYLVMEGAWATRNAARWHLERNKRQMFLEFAQTTLGISGPCNNA